MALSSNARKCVVFLGSQEGVEGSARIRPIGTGFLFVAPISIGAGWYLVTARHIAENLDAPWVVRMNRRGGGAGVMEFTRPEDCQWHYHPDESVDLAVTPFAAPNWADVNYFSGNQSLQPDKLKMKRIDAGDTAHIVGLFHLLHGKEENLPIVHTGHIAMLPGAERVPVEGGKTKDVEGYLVQANAISGCSGSPVFAVRSIPVTVPEEIVDRGDYMNNWDLQGNISGSVWLLGIWQSSWKVKGSEVVSLRTDADDQTGMMAPLGMGVVVPVTKLFELLEIPELKRPREEWLNQHGMGPNPTNESLPSDTGPNTRRRTKQP